MKEDGTPDKRVGTGQFAQGKVDPHEAGAQGGKTSGSGNSGSDDSSSGGSGDKKGKLFHPFLHHSLTLLLLSMDIPKLIGRRALADSTNSIRRRKGRPS